MKNGYDRNRRVLLYQASGFIGVILFLWLEEYLDLPSVLFGFEKTPFNWPECICESVIVSILGMLVLYKSKASQDRIKVLEGLLPICASCKKIRNHSEKWIPLESFIVKNSEATFTHSICPDCSKILYSDLD